MAKRLPPSVRRRRSAALLVMAGAALAAGASGCGESGAVQVRLQAYRTHGLDLRRVEVRAQVQGPQAGLRYKWFTVAGECEPQEGDWPATVFKFGPVSMRDRVSVEAWRAGERVARAELDVTLDQEHARLAGEPFPKVEIEITGIPPYEPEGGPDTRAEISGKVSGEIAPSYKVVVYARADAWYIQPAAYAEHAIGPDNTWKTWTHTGSSYAALVVQPGFDPFLRLDVLPQVGGHVLARTIAEGIKP